MLGIYICIDIHTNISSEYCKYCIYVDGSSLKLMDSWRRDESSCSRCVIKSGGIVQCTVETSSWLNMKNNFLDIRTYIHTCRPTYLQTYLHSYLHPYIHTYVPTYVHTYIPTTCCISTYIHTYIHTYVFFDLYRIFMFVFRVVFGASMWLVIS